MVNPQVRRDLVLLPVLYDRLLFRQEVRHDPVSCSANRLQWNTSVNVIPDFGFGPWRKAKEELVASFIEVYRRVR